MPFPLLESDEAVQQILQDSSHIAYKNISRQEFARDLYRKKFQTAEKELNETGRSLTGSFTKALDCPASRIYACFTSLGRLPQADKGLVYEMVRVAFGWDRAKAEEYLNTVNCSTKGYDKDNI